MAHNRFEMPDNAISAFDGTVHHFLSNFHPTACGFSVEKEYQAAKMDSVRDARSVRFSVDPGQAKRLGNLLTMRRDWSVIKDAVMHGLVRHKFLVDRDLCARLFETAPRPLVEGNTWNDRYWGVCKHKDYWVGLNKLGQILERVRTEIAIIKGVTL